MNIITIVARFTITFILSVIFGVERQKSHKPIGFGTFIFVAVGSCSLAIIALDLNAENPLPLLSAIVTGIGFLGAGALIKTTDKIFGFTSAASIWIFAIFGLSIGTGQYIIGLISYVIIWIVTFYDIYLEKKGIGSYQKRVGITTNRIINEKEIKNILNVSLKRFKLIYSEVDKTK
ncbi:MgtC/SapB family protein [Candidatus Woesearchaeota archaeon]|nr:MgtC/SapB family protein [Candidatus Woesearchaeota archaeon]